MSPILCMWCLITEPMNPWEDSRQPGTLLILPVLPRGAGYTTSDSYVSLGDELADTVNRLVGEKKASFIEVRIHKGIGGGDLPPLKISHHDLIQELMEELQR